jgi:hypothetical protein
VAASGSSRATIDAASGRTVRRPRKKSAYATAVGPVASSASNPTVVGVNGSVRPRGSAAVVSTAPPTTKP